MNLCPLHKQKYILMQMSETITYAMRFGYGDKKLVGIEIDLNSISSFVFLLEYTLQISY